MMRLVQMLGYTVCIDTKEWELSTLGIFSAGVWVCQFHCYRGDVSCLLWVFSIYQISCKHLISH